MTTITRPKLITATDTHGRTTRVRARPIHSDRANAEKVYAVTQQQYQRALARISDDRDDWLGFGEFDVRIIG